ncbi:hypothetical protein [uncultured Flavobacterium sp.]|uniref:hypothetical protein n=1 Tax=uncultured Flavobacterium sp. TaxID=165435 RepID=UPI0025FE3DD9|nr:hypothetical protein [uncultured Flavobacterium sp.]
MDEKEIYKKVLDSLFEGLKIELHDKFKNDRLGERKFPIVDLYPDVIMAKKDTHEIEFIVEIVTESHCNKETLLKKWKPLSETSPKLYLLVPKNKHKIVETWCLEEKMRVRFGTYEFKSNNVELKFY